MRSQSMTRILSAILALFVSVTFAAAQVAPVSIAPAIPPVAPILAHNGMVVAQEARAARIGVEILDRGGNAVDAAVAVGFALAVTYPRAGNIGGGGFMVIHLASGNHDIAVDYRETAPAAATPTMFLDAQGNPDAKKSRDSGLGRRRARHRRRARAGAAKIRLGPIYARRTDGAGHRSRAKRFFGGLRSRRFTAARARTAGALAGFEVDLFSRRRPDA